MSEGEGNCSLNEPIGLNSQSRANLREQYVDVRNLELTLIDIIPYEKKEEMILKLKKLLSNDRGELEDEATFDLIPDMRKVGMLAQGNLKVLGALYNIDYIPDFTIDIRKKLPPEISSIVISVGQFVDYCYTVVCACHIKYEYGDKDIEKNFVTSEDKVEFIKKKPDGRNETWVKQKHYETEPSIRKYQSQLQDFLKPYSCGLFLNPENMLSCRCPSLSVITTRRIGFDNLKNWDLKHSHLLNFLDFHGEFCRLENFLVGPSLSSVFEDRPASYAKGLVMLASMEDYVLEGNDIPADIQASSSVSNLILPNILPIFSLIYWCLSNSEIDAINWKKNIVDLDAKIKVSRSKKNAILDDIYDEVLENYRRFTKYRLEELTKIEKAKRLNSTYSPSFLHEEERQEYSNFEIFASLKMTASYLLELEREGLQEINEKFSAMLGYCNDYFTMDLNKSNLQLQKRMRNYTVAMLFLTFIAVLIPIFQAYGHSILQLIDAKMSLGGGLMFGLNLGDRIVLDWISPAILVLIVIAVSVLSYKK